MIDVINWTLSH